MEWIRKTEALEEKIEELEAEVEFLRCDNLVKSKLIGKLMLENKELAKPKDLSNLLASSGIGELSEYLMDKGIGLVGDMTAKVALDHIKSLEAELAKRSVVYCAKRSSGESMIEIKPDSWSTSRIDYPTL